MPARGSKAASRVSDRNSSGRHSKRICIPSGNSCPRSMPAEQIESAKPVPFLRDRFHAIQNCEHGDRHQLKFRKGPAIRNTSRRNE
jgi:hypothetical protein